MSTVTKVYSNIRGLQTAIKDGARLRQILVVLAKHGFGAVVTRLGLHQTVGVKNLMSYTDEKKIPFSTAQRIRMAIEELGPTFIKLGQILSTRSDLLPADLVLELQALQDRVPSMPWDEVQEQICAALGAPAESVFRELDPEPLASASVAQVHRALLPDGQDVAVKVKRKGIEVTVESDLSILQFLAKRSEALIPELELIDPVGIVTEFERAIRRELDFTNERRFIDRFRRNFEGNEAIRIPRTHEALCSSSVLTLGYVHGVKVTQAAEELGIDPYELAPTLMRAVLQMILRDGLFHGDLHPGNILIEAGGRIVLIDFGLVGRLNRQQRDNILDLLIGVSREDYQVVARILFDIGIKVPDARHDYAAFERDVTDIIERHLADKSLSEVDVQAMFAELVTGAIRHQIKLPPAYTMVFKALMTVEGIGKTLVPEINFIEEAKPFARDLLLERYDPRRLAREAAEVAGIARRFLRQVPLSVAQILRDTEQGKLTVRVELANLAELTAQRQRTGRLQANALLVSACSVAGTLALSAPGRQVLGMSVVSVVFYGLALAFAVPVLWSLLRGR